MALSVGSPVNRFFICESNACATWCPQNKSTMPTARQISPMSLFILVSFDSPAFAPHKTQQQQQHHRAHKGADQIANDVGGGDAQQAEDKSAHQRPDDTDDQIAEDAETVAF